MPFIKHDVPDYEDIIAQLKEENRMVRAMNFKLTTKLEEVMKEQGMTRTRRPPPPAEDPTKARRRKGKDPMLRSAKRNSEFSQWLKSNNTRSMAIERGLNFKDLEGTSFIDDVDRLGWRTYYTI
ncbi:hypothetical protein Ddye_020538 [Dipteronia dyeriana]|uniref:Uncharacterized protein n=1 Tax=Dipteronia dyeriana TaxID=168575 RepID=A0AAD9U0D7_9ROSI|nr:hypothetical protein Ddye_020538 [Dipteronia dyeriana]